MRALLADKLEFAVLARSARGSPSGGGWPLSTDKAVDTENSAYAKFSPVIVVAKFSKSITCGRA